MDLLHRLPKAILVTIVAFLFFGGTVGVVVAQGTEPLPETFQVAEPREGDRWEYRGDITLIQDGGVETDEDLIGFEWLPPEQVYDRFGNPHHVQPLLDVEADHTAYVDVESKEIIAQSFVHDFEESGHSTSFSIAGIRPLAEEYTAKGNTTIISYFEEPAPCGFFTELQGQQLPLDEPIHVYGGCTDILDLENRATAFEAFGTDTWDGIPTVGFRAQHGENTTEVWYNPDIPYPVRMEFDITIDLADLFPDVPENESIQIELSGTIRFIVALTMTGFEPGSGPWGDTSAALRPPLSFVVRNEITRTGPDDSGIDHPFPLSDAFQGAMEDPTYSDLRDWMADHPDGRIAKATHFATVDGDFDVHTWSFVMWDEEGGYWTDVRAERRIAHAGTPVATLQEVTGPQESYETETEMFGLDFLFTRKAEIPEKPPTVASVMQRFQGATGHAATTYGFDYLCVVFCWLGEADALFVGREDVVQTSSDPVTGEPGTIESIRHFFHYSETGAMNMEQRTETHGETWNAGVLGQTGSTPQGQVTEDSMPALKNDVWSTPTPEATAGIGFVALLIGAAYWLWPSLKMMPFFSLFSRVRPDQMLDHPIRAHIYEAIKADPGIHYQALVRRIGKGSSVVDHHLRKLDLGNYISVQKGRGFTCFFPKGVVDHRIMMVVPVLRTEGASRVLREVVKQPGQSVSEVARSVGIAKSTVSYHVSRLRKVHLLEEGRALMPTADAKQALSYAA